MTLETTGVEWPAIIVYAGDCELEYVENQMDWDSNFDLTHDHFDIEDRLIDVEGAQFTLCPKPGNAKPVYLNRHLALDEINDIIKSHLSQLGHCCISKFSNDSIAEAIAFVKHSI